MRMSNTAAMSGSHVSRFAHSVFSHVACSAWQTRSIARFGVSFDAKAKPNMPMSGRYFCTRCPSTTGAWVQGCSESCNQQSTSTMRSARDASRDVTATATWTVHGTAVCARMITASRVAQHETIPGCPCYACLRMATWREFGRLINPSQP